MNGLYLDFSADWWKLTLIFYIPWLFLFVQRQTYRKPRELRNQIIFAFCCLLLAITAETIGVAAKLWAYLPVNWPIIVWVDYFGAGLVGFQLTKKIEELLGKWYL